MTFMQDAAMRERGLYRFFLYDRLGRLAVQGTCTACERGERPNIAEYEEKGGGICNTGYKVPFIDKITNPNLETVNYYDRYDFIDGYAPMLGNDIGEFRVSGANADGLPTGNVQAASDGTRVLYALFYDSKGRITDTRQLTEGRRLTAVHTEYSYTGKPVRTETKEYGLNGGDKRLAASLIQENRYSKNTDKLLAVTLTVNGKTQTVQRLKYDKLGRVSETVRDGNAGTVSHEYNLHGWTTNIKSKDFSEKLYYTDGVGLPCYNGNISSTLWRTSEHPQTRGYKFTYDGLDRMKEAVYGEGESLSDKRNRYNEKVVEYTANGAIRRFQRRGLKDDGEYGKIDNLSIRLDGNRLLSVTDDALPVNKYSSMSFIDGADEEVEYTYNGVGTLTSDLNRGITCIEYDNLNNPRRILFKDGTEIIYAYLPDGMKLSKTVCAGGGLILADSMTTEYSGDIVYENGRLDKVLFQSGYCTLEKGCDNPTFHYFTQDHLGNNRTVVNEDGTVEQITHYYPFGGTFNDAGLNPELQQYKYNSKELDRTEGLNAYDYGARMYFQGLPTWDRMDPLCEEDYPTSPYAYCRNNPIKNIDKDGNKTILYATTLPGGPEWLTFPTHTFVVVYRNGHAPEYFAYGPQGEYIGPLRRVFYEQDIAVYKGKDEKHLKNKIVISPPKGKTEEDFDEDVINTAKSFGNIDEIQYKLLPFTDNEGNCNTSSSTLLYKSGISKEKLKSYKKEIKGNVSGFGNIKSWTKEEQDKTIKEKNILEKIYEWLKNI